MNDSSDTLLKIKRGRYLSFFLAFAIIVFLLILISRTSFISDTLKELVTSELQALTGEKVTIGSLSLNVFPLFIEAKDVRVLLENKRTLLTAKQVKGYVRLSWLLNKKLIIQRLVISDPVISGDRARFEETIRHVRAYLEQERETAIKVTVKVIEIRKGAVSITDTDANAMMFVKGLEGEFITGESSRLKASVKEFVLDRKGWPKITCDISTVLTIKNREIVIKRLEVGSFGSQLTAEGHYTEGKGLMKTNLSLIINSVKNMFNLRQSGEGRLSAKGEIRLAGDEQSAGSGPRLEDIILDLKLGGDFPIQTLMELLDVKDKIEGFITLQGKLTGPLSDLSGDANARLQNGNLYGVDIDMLSCRVLYADGIMKFENGYAKLYNGEAKAHASIPLPVVDSLILNVQFHSADSQPVLKLIGWEPEIPPGKVEGELLTSGKEFNPNGWFFYKSLSADQRAMLKGYRPLADNVLNRIKEMKGNYSLQGHVISLSNMSLHTHLSGIALNGTVDLERKTIGFAGRLSSENVSDLTLPYYREIKGKGEFSGEIRGPFDDPKISGKTTLSNPVIEGYGSDRLTTDFAYQKKRLEIHEALIEASGEAHTIKGEILFPEAKELFDLSGPVFNLHASVRNADFVRAVQMFYRDFRATGRMDADIRIENKEKELHISGKASVDKASVYGLPIDSATGLFTYRDKEFSLKQIRMVRGKSVMNGEGKILPQSTFSYKVTSEKFYARDFGPSSLPEDLLLSLRSEGQGTFENPQITLDAKLAGGTFRGRDIGGGSISAVVQNKNISVNGSFSNDKIRLKGTGLLDNSLPWNAELTVQPARYDFLMSSFLKDIPEDLQLTLDGNIEMTGDRHSIRASANINHLTLSLFGQTFLSDSQIRFSLNNKKLSMTRFALKSGETSFRIQGGLEIGKEYDLTLDGSSSLAPLKGLSKKIGYLKGDTDFVFSLKGKWDKPEINGGMNVTDASFGLRDYPTYISSINGYLYTDADKIVLHGLSGKIGAGDVNITGIVYLKAFSLKRFYIETQLKGIPVNVAKDFTMSFDGNLLYKGTSDAQTITGDIQIKRALYKNMVEWRSWLLAPKSKEKPKSEASVLEKAELNIRISGSENISIDNNIARAPVSISGDMIVKGTLVNPVIFGRIESKEGYVYFRNNEFRILHASVDFADPNRIKPVINMTAETNVKGYDIRLNLEGQLDRFDLALSSDPHLDEVDILSLLTVGQVGKQLKGLEGGVGAGTATSFITGKAQDVIEERVRTLTGLDRFQVEPYVSQSTTTSNVSKTTSTVEPRVTVSERLIGDKVYVTYATSLGSTEQQIIKVEYILDKHISLIGSRDERGIVGGDIKFRFEFK